VDGESSREETAPRKASSARDALLRTLLDQHGTGRVMFRNTRAGMHGFPKRKFCPASLEGASPALLTRVARELEAEETGNEAGVRHSFKDDPRIDWLAAFLKKHRAAKVLLICRSQRKVAAIEAALLEKMKAKVALFHEGLPLVQRDRNAAWFAEADGAQLLLCSEIGSEGRNFQFAHHLVHFDLPLNPGLIEQRIGRLDRIGQTQTIQIHVPYLAGSAAECVAEWYHRGLESFETPLHSGDEYQARFREALLILALSFGREPGAKAGKKELDALIAETAAFRRELTKKLHDGRDRLLELNSFNREVAERVIGRVREADADPFVKEMLVALLDHFGVRLAEHETGEMFLDPTHAYVESFPSIPRDGMLVTFDRRRAIAREDIVFLSQDHSLVRDALDLLINSPAGTTAFSVLEADEPNLVLEAIFVLEAVADSRWHVDQFLAPTPVRVVVDVRGRDLSVERNAEAPDDAMQDGKIQRFLERPGFDAAVLKAMLDGAGGFADAKSRLMKRDAAARANAALGADVQRLVDLRKLNDNVRLEEIELAQERLRQTAAAIDNARLRLDSLRLVLEGPADTFESE
jgi:ATP-dependent helicase HepA